MKGLVGAMVILMFSLIFGQIIDESIDSSIKISTGPVVVLLNIVKILLGFPNDIIELILKILVLAGIAIGGEAI